MAARTEEKDDEHGLFYSLGGDLDYSDDNEPPVDKRLRMTQAAAAKAMVELLSSCSALHKGTGAAAMPEFAFISHVMPGILFLNAAVEVPMPSWTVLKMRLGAVMDMVHQVEEQGAYWSYKEMLLILTHLRKVANAEQTQGIPEAERTNYLFMNPDGRGPLKEKDAPANLYSNAVLVAACAAEFLRHIEFNWIDEPLRNLLPPHLAKHGRGYASLSLTDHAVRAYFDISTLLPQTESATRRLTVDQQEMIREARLALRGEVTETGAVAKAFDRLKDALILAAPRP